MEEKLSAGIGIIIVLIVSVIVGKWIAHIRSVISERQWLPEELRAAELSFAERTFRIWRPIALIARIDRGYRLGEEIRLAEFKTRPTNKVYRSDVIELSAQRMAMEKNTGVMVSKIGYVFLQDRNGKRKLAKRVFLMDTKEIIDLAARRQGIIEGKIQARYAESDGLCKVCAYKSECRPD